MCRRRVAGITTASTSSRSREIGFAAIDTTIAVSSTSVAGLPTDTSSRAGSCFVSESRAAYSRAPSVVSLTSLRP